MSDFDHSVLANGATNCPFAMMKAKKDSFPAADSDPRFLDACDVAVLL